MTKMTPGIIPRNRQDFPELTGDGFFIAVEGVDGAGKTSVVKMLAQALQAKYADRNVVSIRAPGSTPMNEVIRNQILLRQIPPGSTEVPEPIDGDIEVPLFMTCHLDSLKKHVWPAINRGDILVSDRYIDTTFAYQGYGRGHYKLVSDMFRIMLRNFQPDVTLYVKADSDVMERRLTARVDERNRLDAESYDFKRRIRDGMEKCSATRLFEEPGRTFVIENNGTQEELQKAVNSFVHDVLLSFVIKESQQ